jgi:hypothetical protein
MLNRRKLLVPRISETCEMLLDWGRSTIESADPFRQLNARRESEMLEKQGCRKGLLRIKEHYKSDPSPLVRRTRKTFSGAFASGGDRGETYVLLIAPDVHMDSNISSSLLDWETAVLDANSFNPNVATVCGDSVEKARVVYIPNFPV